MSWRHRTAEVYLLVHEIERKVFAEGFEFIKDTDGEFWSQLKARVRKQGRDVYTVKAELLWLRRVAKRLVPPVGRRNDGAA